MSNGYANPKVLVETQWAADHLADANVRLVEVDVDTAAYGQGHVRGAIGWNWTSQLEDQVRRDIPDKAAWEALLRQSGIANDHTIVFYGDNNNWFAAFAYWLGKVYGHDDARLMNGGRKKWLAENRELVTDPPNYAPTQYQAKEPNLELRALQPRVREHLARPGAALVDVRSPQEFTGEILAPPGLSENAQRGGHIPGAQNIPWGQAANEDGTFKAADELRQLYGSKGISAEKDIIAYCRIGERSSHTWFVLKELLGYPKVRNYDGSWTEWGSMIGVPIEKSV